MSRRLLAAAVVLMISATPFVLATAGCDQFGRTRHPQSTSTTSQDGGDFGGDGGAAPRPTISAQPGDIQL